MPSGPTWSHIPGAPGFNPAPPKPDPREPAVVSQPRVARELQRGTNLIANAVRPTLGPRPRLVANEKLLRTEPAEFLDDGATIARRITEVKPRGADVGAMLIRQALWRMHVDVGDGTTTMAILYQMIFNEGLRYVKQMGANAMLLRAGFEAGLEAIVAELDRAATPITGREQTALMARGMCQEDQEMANTLGEIFDIVGPDGLIIVEPGHRYELEREYIEGTYWHLSGWLSRWLVTEKADNRTTFEDTALLISDFTITDPNQLVPALDRCVKAGVKKLIIVCKSMSDSAIGLLVTNNQAKTIETLAVRAPKVGGQEQVNAIEDIAVLTGGRAFHADGKDSFENFRIEDLGYARRAWAAESMFGLFGGKGDARKVRQRIAALRAQLPDAEVKNERKNLQQRLGRLTGATALLKVGGISATEIETRKETAERAITALRKSLQGGVVAGGGAALLNLQSALEGLPSPQPEYGYAYTILARALEEPMRTIAFNAGCNPDVMVEKVKALPKEYGVDARTRQIVNMRQAGILDAVLVLKKALEIGVHSAALALTTDVVIHHKKPQISIEP